MLKRDERAARASFDRALELDPGSLDALTGLIGLDVAAKNPAAAVVRVEAALARSPADLQLLLLAARTYRAAGDQTRTEQTLQQVIEREPSSLQAYGMLGQLYVSQHRLDDAIGRFEQMAARQPRPVAAQTMIAMILQTQGKYAEAQKGYERVLKIDSRAAVAANNLAWLYAERGGGSLEAALQLAQTAKQALPDQPEVSDTLGWIYYKRELAGLAIPPFLEAVAKSPSNSTYHFHLGLAYQKVGDFGKAKTSFEQALRLNPKFPEAGEARRALTTVQ
jgi:tetratricopeptide (TPR) repeat protein